MATSGWMGGLRSELQHGPLRQSVGQVRLASPTRQALGHHKNTISFYAHSILHNPSTAHRNSEPVRDVARGSG